MGGSEEKEKSTPPTRPKPTVKAYYPNSVQTRQETGYVPSTYEYPSQRHYAERPETASQPRASPAPSNSYAYTAPVPPSTAQKPYSPSPSASVQKSPANPQTSSVFPSYSRPIRPSPPSKVPYYSSSQETQPRPVEAVYSQHYQEQRPAVSVPSPSVQSRPRLVAPVETPQTSSYAQGFAVAAPRPQSKPTPVVQTQPTYIVPPQPAYKDPVRPTAIVPSQPAYIAPARPAVIVPPQPAYIVPPAVIVPVKPAIPASIFFRSLYSYKDHFFELLELERREEAEVFRELFQSAKLSFQSSHGNRFLYSLKFKSVENLNFGDQFRLSYADPEHEKEVVHIHELIEEEKRVVFQGKYHDGVKVKYYRSLPHRRMVDKLDSFDDEHPLLELILGDAEKENRDWRAREYVPSTRVKLDDSQKQAISTALTSELTLILGPPGSGKTSVAAELVVQLYKRGGKILVCAPSNVAADNLALRLKERQVRVMRFYSKGSEKKTNIADKFAFHSYVHSLACVSFPEHTQKLLNCKTFSRNDVKSIIGDEEVKALERDVLGTFQVICSTCAASADAILADFVFDSLLIDEAAFCGEPEALIPIVVSKCKKLVLIGDPKQLRPIIASDEAKRKGLEISLFERLQKAGMNTQWLEVQYRMHPDISYYPRTCFYEGRLKDGITADDRSLEGLKVASLFRGKPLLIVHCEGKEKYYPNSTSRWNAEEAETTISVLERLKSLEVPLSTIGLVTPYEGQRQTLVKRVYERLDLTEEDIEIKNVDGYQGREKDFIVMSCVRSGVGNIGFLANPNRINVALTRAKYGLVVVGNSDTLKIDPIWAGFVDCVQQRGRLITETDLGRE